MFKIDGSIDVTVIDAYVSEAKFGAQQNEANSRNEWVQVYYDICLLLQDKDGNTDTWHGEISNRTGTGTKAHLYRLDLTIETLQEIGFGVTSLQELEQQFVAAADRTITIPNLIGLQCSASVVKSDKTDRNGNPYYNVRYLNKLGSGGNRKLTMEEIMARRGMPAAAPAAPAAPAQYQSAAPMSPQPAAGTPAAAAQYQPPQPAPAAAPAPQGYAQRQAPPAAPAPAPGVAVSPTCPY